MAFGRKRVREHLSHMLVVLDQEELHRSLLR
jgi:hypothetical protein